MKLKTAFLAALLCSTASVAMAAQPKTPKSPMVVPYVGWFDFIDNGNTAMQIGAEYRFSPIWRGFRPMLGASVTDDSSVYGYAGFDYDFVLAKRFYVTPNFAVGLYHDSDGKDLGGPIEFRSGIEFGYGFNDASRISLAFNHISNASIYDKNPGAETLLVGYHIPW